jgi:hypothetical protein
LYIWKGQSLHYQLKIKAMKKNVSLFVGIAIFLLTAIQMNGQFWAANGLNIYNTNNGNVGIGNNNPGKLLDVSKFMGEPTIRVYNPGAGGGATFEMQDLVSGADWKFKSTSTGGFKIRDHANGLDVVFVEPGSLTDALYIKAGGNVGLGFNNPLEKLDVNGAVRIGSTTTNNAGTIQFNGVNFMGYDGVSWLQLDNLVSPPTWLIFPNPAPGTGNPQLYPANPPASITNALPGMPNSGGWIHAVDAPAPGLYPHQLMLESMTGPGGALGASQLFRISNGFNPPFIDFSMGIFSGDGTFKLTNVPNLFPTTHSDNISMLRVFPNGIVDLPNQSRVRAYQVDPNGFNQMIPPNLWVPVNFTMDAPPSQGYDEQNEFIVVPNANLTVPPEISFFVAFQEGYYQVNARVEFVPEVSQEGGPVSVNPMSYVSIAIYTGPGPGATLMYSQGNNLQIGMPAGPMFYNNAPNVSDVVYLMPGQIISIWVFQSANTPMDLMQGPNKTYVSIHKVS